MAEIHLNAAIVNKHVIHLVIRVHGALLRLKLNERVAERVARLVIADDLAALHAKTEEDHAQVLVLRNWIQLANKENVLRRLHVRIREITDHLQHDRVTLCLQPLSLLLELLSRLSGVLVLQVLLRQSARNDLLLRNTSLGRVVRNHQSGWVVVGIVDDVRVENADVHVGSELLVAERLHFRRESTPYVVYLLQHIHSLHHLGKYGVLLIQIVDVVSQRNVKLLTVHVLLLVRHRHRSHLHFTDRMNSDFGVLL